MARARNKPEPEGGPGFLTTYADIVTLLMAFFVLLFAISSIDQVKFLALLKGLEKDFGNTAYDDLIIDGGQGVLEVGNQPAGSPIPVPGGTLTAEPLEEVENLAILAGAVSMSESDGEDEEATEEPIPDGLAMTSGRFLDTEQLVEVASRLQDVAVERAFDGAIELGFNERGLVVIITTDGVLFDSGSADLDQDLAAQILGPIAEELSQFDNSVYIEGHTDDVPLDRNGYSNWDLSVDRALAVLDYFELTEVIDPARLVASGYGEYRPVNPETTPEARQQNRRVELVVAYESGSFGDLESLEDILAGDDAPAAEPGDEPDPSTPIPIPFGSPDLL